MTLLHSSSSFSSSVMIVYVGVVALLLLSALSSSSTSATVSAFVVTPTSTTMKTKLTTVQLQMGEEDDWNMNKVDKGNKGKNKGNGFFQAIGNMFEELDAFVDDAS